MKLDGFAGHHDSSTSPPGYQLRIIDYTDPRWPAVLAALTAAGQRHVLKVREGGWISARQCVAAAFCGETVVGFVVFHVELFRSAAGGMRLQPGGVAMHAVIDVATTSAQHRAVATPLVELAKQHAQTTLRCVEFDQQWLAA